MTRLSSEQQLAVEICIDVRVPIASVTGGAGTGKTLVLGEVCNELKSKGISYALCAPTGRAAKRIKELTGNAARTIHKLLEYPQPDDGAVNDDGDIDLSKLDDAEYEQYQAGKPSKGQRKSTNQGEPKRGRGYPFEEQVIIVDEASMVGPTLYRQLLDALRKGGAIRFFGDNNQLLPVEEGAPPFRTVLVKYPSVTLTFNFRSGDAIVSNALRVLEGRIPIRNERFDIIYTDYPVNELVRHIQERPAFGSETHQVIMPTRKGSVGTLRVNPSLQVKLNPFGKLLRLDRFDEKEAKLAIRPRDKYLWVKNDYALNMFNGEIGMVKGLDENEGTLFLLNADGRQIEVPPRIRGYNSYLGTMINYDPRKQIELGYAVTTHKSQGSEFDEIVYCMSRSAAFLLNRNNFYTAVTRARNKVVIITDRRAMSLALRREGST